MMVWKMYLQIQTWILLGIYVKFDGGNSLYTKLSDRDAWEILEENTIHYVTTEQNSEYRTVLDNQLKSFNPFPSL